MQPAQKRKPTLTYFHNKLIFNALGIFSDSGSAVGTVVTQVWVMPGYAHRGSGVPVFPNQLQLRFPEAQRAPEGQTIAVRCEQCRNPFGVPRWFVRGNVRLHFCGKTCLDAWTSVLPEGENRPVLRGRPEYRGGNWKVQTALARERDGFRCRNCGVTEETLGRQLDVHHKTPVRLFASASAANRLDNLISVCASCHKRLEDRLGEELPLFHAVRHPGQRQDLE